MKRFLEKKLLNWFQSSSKNFPRKPLILRGARQVGKSTLIRQWAESMKLQLIEINLEEYQELDEVFKSNRLDLILAELEVIHGKAISDKGTLLFLDEIQAVPQALAALRFFYEKRPDLPVIAAGSLLEFVLKDHAFSMPVGRIEYLHLGPMSFQEFLLALGEESLLRALKKFQQTKTIPRIAHQDLLRRQREYLWIGGMPECVLTYQRTKDLSLVRRVHRSIIQTYRDDFGKYASKGELARLQKIMREIPKIIGKKINYSQISREDHSRLIKEAIELLVQARLFIQAYHSNCSGLPLASGVEERIYKLYFLDVGLWNYISGVEWPMISKLDERSLLSEGVLAEQFIAQHLAYQYQGEEAPQLFYWLRKGKSSNAEVDFVFSKNNQIIPIEVKSGKSGSLKSLLQFAIQKKTKLAYRFDLNLPSSQKVEHKLGQGDHSITAKFQLESYPLYLIEEVLN